MQITRIAIANVETARFLLTFLQLQPILFQFLFLDLGLSSSLAFNFLSESKEIFLSNDYYLNIRFDGEE